MAKAPAPADNAEAPKKSKKLLIIILIVVLVVLLLGAAAVVALLLLKKGDGEDEAAAAAAAPPPAATAVAAPPGAVDLSKPPTFVPLDPFVVNLAAGEGDRYLQVVMALRVVDAKTGDGLKGFMPDIRHRINLLLRSKLPSELATAEGQEALANEIANSINQTLGFPAAPPGSTSLVAGGPVQAVLFNSFIIQ